MKRLIYIFFLLVFQSCFNSDFDGKLMPSSSGKTGDVLVVMPEESWKSFTGDTLFNWLTQAVMVLPQPEAVCKVVHINPNLFNNLFKKSRNIIIADIDPKNEKNYIKVQTDVYASPQLFITISAKNDSAWRNIFYKAKQYIIDTITVAEHCRYLSYFNLNHNTSAETELHNTHSIDITVPSMFNLDVNKENFVWLSRETEISSQGILLFQQNYNGPEDFELQNMIRRIDSVLMLNVPGPSDGSFMAIEKRVEPLRKQFLRNKNYVCELRGLWQTEGDFMGGPFVSQTLVDTLSNTMTTAFAFVYGGKNDKKLLLWQLESILRTFKPYSNSSDAKN